MATSLRDLRRKIKSITSTQKITSAMQLVAASKMQRATRRATESRPFTDLASELMGLVSPAIDPTGQPLFQIRPHNQVLVLLVTTNRGLTGPLNTQLLRQFGEWQRQQERAGRTVRVVAVGAKGRQYVVRYYRDRLLADFLAPDRVPDYRDASPIGQLLIDEFVAARADAVFLAYNKFVSTLRQEPVIVPYLPFQPTTIGSHATDSLLSDFVFEPSQAEILATLVPRYLRARLYQVLLETHASEQSARMLAMKNATDNAGNLIDDLTLTYNGARQSAITGELLDIAGGAAALEAR